MTVGFVYNYYYYYYCGDGACELNTNCKNEQNTLFKMRTEQKAHNKSRANTRETTKRAK